MENIKPPKLVDVSNLRDYMTGYNYFIDNWGLVPSTKSFYVDRKNDEGIDEFISWLRSQKRYVIRTTQESTPFSKKKKDRLRKESLDFIIDKERKVFYSTMASIHAWTNGVGTTLALRVNFVDPEDIDQELINQFIRLHQKSREGKPKIHLISVNKEGYRLIENSVAETKINYSLHYNDDLSKDILPILNTKLKKEGKGLFLFHGSPGTGKTTFIKHLTKVYKDRKFIFLPPNMSGQLSSPDFTEFLLTQKDSILIIEDAENILKKREAGTNQAISNLLNITDGLLSDILNIVVICTFNCDHNQIDEALQRKGRLTARYEFKKLTPEKAQKLSNSLGYKTIIDKEMALTDVINQNKISYKQEKTKIGF